MLVRMKTRWDTVVSPTGRMYSELPSVQLIPRSVRNSVRPRPGYIFVYGDYSAAEFRLIASLSKAKALYEPLEKGLDIHRAVASMVYEIPEDQVTKEQREAMKAFNYGIQYGIQADSLANKLDITKEEAQVLIDKWRAKFPEVQKYLDSLKKEYMRTGKIKTMFGHTRDLSKDPFSKAIREAKNTPLQGGVAYLLKLSVVKIYKAFKAKWPDSRIVLTVHDSILTEVPESAEQEAKSLMKQLMEYKVPDGVTMTADVKSGKSWKELE